VTATAAEDAQAAQAVTAGMTAAATHQADAQQQHGATGSTVVVEQPSTPDDVAVDWIPSGDDTAQPTLVPSEPRPVGLYRGEPPTDTNR
jgi:hypothetical protein